ncbi:MAG: 2-hydroxyacid dehydrogenase, partial [Janthinobacterium sp.]
MKIAFFASQPYDRRFFDEALPSQPDAADIELVYHSASLSQETVVLAQGVQAVCVFVNDVLDAPVLEALHGYGVRAILLRCAGYNNLDLEAAKRLGFFVARVPAYSPEAVAEYTLALVQTLNRNTHRAYARVR